MLNIDQISISIADLEKDIVTLDNKRIEFFGYISDIENANEQKDFDNVLRILRNKGIFINNNVYKKNSFNELMRIITKEISIDEAKLYTIIEEIETLEKTKEEFKNKIYYSDLADKMWPYKKIYIKENGFGNDDGTASFEELVGMIESQKIKEFDLEEYGFNFITFDHILASIQENKG